MHAKGFGLTLGLVIAISAFALDVRAQVPVYTAQWGVAGQLPGQLHRPNNLAVDVNGDISVGEPSLNRIQTFTPSGTYVRHVTCSQQGFTLDGGGNVLLAGSDRCFVQAINGSGGFIARWGGCGVGPEQFRQDFDAIAAGPDGRVYVADTYASNIKVFSNSGAYIARWGTPGYGDGYFGEIHGIAVDEAGNVFVADTYNHRIQVFTSDGAFVGGWGGFGSGPGQFNQVFGIAVDRFGYVYATDRYNYRVQMFTKRGRYLGQFGMPGTGGDDLAFAFGVAVDHSGTVYVADAYRHRVKVYSRDLTPARSTSWGRIKLLHR